MGGDLSGKGDHVDQPRDGPRGSRDESSGSGRGLAGRVLRLCSVCAGQGCFFGNRGRSRCSRGAEVGEKVRDDDSIVDVDVTGIM
jgi:hypothetical protein